MRNENEYEPVKLASYQVDWLKAYFKKHIKSKPVFEIDRDESSISVKYSLEDDVYDILLSSDMILDLVKHGFNLPFFGISNFDADIFEINVSVDDESIEYDLEKL